jgi:hypothetical protein
VRTSTSLGAFDVPMRRESLSSEIAVYDMLRPW